MKLYKHQQALVDLAPHKHLLAWECGTGKTLPAIKLAELYRKKTLVICPKSLTDNWFKEIKEFSDPKLFAVLTKEQFRAMAKELPKHDTIIVDECFVAGTQVLTSDGYKNIEDIVVGDYVKNAIGWRRVSMKKQRDYYDEIIKIKLDSGKEVGCTKNHRFLTQHGWERAEDLTIMSVLLTHDYVNDIMSIYANSFTYKKYVSMFKLWKRKSRRLSGKGEKNVFKELSAEISLEKETSIHDRIINEFAQSKALSCYPVFSTNETEQSDEKRKDKKESFCHIKKDGLETEDYWGEWQGDASPTKGFINRARGWLGWRICCHNKEDNPENTAQLQSRYSKPKKNDSNRGGWWLPQLHKEKGPGQKENKGTNLIGMESLSFQKQYSDARFKKCTKVYNLMVEGHPSYTVNNILVHNCHYFSGMKSQMSKMLRGYIKKHNPTNIFFLTATPYMSTPWNIYTLAAHLGKKWSYPAFKYKYFNDIMMGHRMIPVIKKGIEKKIAGMVNSLGSTVKLSDCKDVPDSIFIEEYFELTKEQKDGIEDLEASIPIAFWTKCHQIAGGTLKNMVKDEPDTHFKSEKHARVLDLCKEHPKLAIVCRYNAEIDHIADKLNIPGKPVFIIRGDTKNKDELVNEINKSDKCIVLIQAACSEGYNMPGIPIMVFYSYDFSLKNYIQMRGRIQRINAIQKCVYISLIVKGTVDEDVYKSVVIKKQDFQVAIYDKEKD